jgi:hypothetical protein
MEGQIGTFNNELAPGSTFWFELPLQVPEDEADVTDRSVPITSGRR